MGSLSGRSKAPTQPVQQVVYVPAPAAPTEPAVTAPTETEEQGLQARAETILKRSRSRLGTVLTGFQGVLSQNDLISPRKTLLGE